MRIDPAPVRGVYHSRRSLVQAALLLFFLILPWTTIQGKQTVLLDIAHGRFYLLGLSMSYQDAPMIFIFIIIGTLGLAYVTAIWGRVWCGWACPQTVFIDGFYRRIEKWTEGSFLKRRELLRKGASFERIWRSSLKWLLFILFSSILAHSFAAYFAGASTLVEWIQRPPKENIEYFTFISGLTALLAFNFGWFRENFCIIVCPYGRIQNLLMDEGSLTVLYDEKRGEPRKGVARGSQTQGDCVSCQRCVQVCPTGIDIRNGQQLACLACTACIDACDEIMTKIGKPKGLIKYGTLSGQQNSWLQIRPLLYLGGIVLAMVALAFALNRRPPLDVTILRGAFKPYEIVSNPGEPLILTNHLRLALINQSDSLQSLTISSTRSDVELMPKLPKFELRAGEKNTVHVFLKFSASALQTENGRVGEIRIESVSDGQVPVQKSLNVDLIGPDL